MIVNREKREREEKRESEKERFASDSLIGEKDASVETVDDQSRKMNKKSEKNVWLIKRAGGFEKGDFSCYFVRLSKSC